MPELGFDKKFTGSKLRYFEICCTRQNEAKYDEIAKTGVFYSLKLASVSF
jgi:hypothetical protein